MSNTLTFEYRTVTNPTLARQYGYTKRHVLVEVFAVGKWRAIRWVTPLQLSTGKWQVEAENTLRTNGGAPKDLNIPINFKFLCNVAN